MDAKQCKEAAVDCPQSQPTTEVDSIQYNALQENLLLRLQRLCFRFHLCFVKCAGLGPALMALYPSFLLPRLT